MEASVWKRKINLFLLGIPLVVLHQQGLLDLGEWGMALVFACAALSLIPLAGFLESAVEELAELLGPFIGGLLHTTCSNIAELTIALAVLTTFATANGADVVTSSIAGVIIRNSLLFLGLATLLGCLRNGRMSFSAKNAAEYSTIFALATVGLSLPTLAYYIAQANVGAATTATESAALGPIDLCAPGSSHLCVLGRYPLSALLAVLLLIVYLGYIAFVVFHVRADDWQPMSAHRRTGQHQVAAAEAGAAGLVPLPTQPDTQALFRQEREQAEAELDEELQAEGAAPLRSPLSAHARLIQEKRVARKERGEERLLAGHPLLRGLLAVVILGVATAGVASMSEAFAGTVEDLLKNNAGLDRYEFFLGLILIPVLAGLVELYGSVGMARRNKMEITMAVTAGATIQMILLIVPIIVLVGAFTGHPVDLVFKPLEVIIFGAATFVYMLLSRDGESTLLEGVQLCALWAMLAVVALFLRPV